jgi:YaiO family outer membrane protein
MLPALLLTLQLGAQVITSDQAEVLVREGRYEEALSAFRQMVGRNPRDLRGRLQIAHLHGLMGNPELAEPVYRAVTLEDPAMLEAHMGLGNALMALARFDDAIAAFQRADKLAPRNAEILAALGSAHRLAGNTTQAIAYSELAVQVAPGQQTQLSLERARMAHNHRIELTSFGEHYNTGVQNTGSGDLRVNFRAAERLRVIGRGQYQRKFGFSEERGGAGLEWRWQPTTSVFAQALAGPGNVVLPRMDVNVGVVHTYRESLWAAGYRFFDFGAASVSVLSPSFTWPLTPRLSIGGDYHLALTSADGSRTVADNHSGTIRAAYQVVPRLWVTAAGTRGIENLETFSVDRIAGFEAKTVSGGVRFDLPSLTSVFGLYERQWRADDVEMDRLSIGIVQRF